MALDPITSAFLHEFLDVSDTASNGETSDFERFATYVLVTPYVESALSYGSIITGDGGDTGIDSVSIIVNGSLVTDADEIEQIIENNTALNVHFIFVQTKTSTSFSTKDVGQIEYGVTDFFSPTPTLKRNEILADAANVAQIIYQNARLFRNGNPNCTVYYVTNGRWTGDSDLSARIVSSKSALEELNIFDQVSFIPIDARALQQRYQALQRGIEREFTFPSRVAFPDIDGVAESHLGYITASDLLNLLCDDDGVILNSVFYDNVRDFQGENNSVNAEIAKTLTGDSSQRFALMNNGVTIIAKSVQLTGHRFLARDFQIVNGCQTCNVLWANRKDLAPDVHVPLKLIATENEDIISDVIRATNRQTEVKEEQFLASSDYLKLLEQYFASTPESQRLHFERRHRQYAGSNVERTRVVPFNTLVRAFASIVLKEPHRATKNYRQILDRIPVDVLNANHLPEIYYACASALYRLEYLFRNSILDRRFSPAKYHLLLASQLIIAPTVPRQLNGRPAREWAKRLAEVYWDPEASEKIFKKAAKDIERLADGVLTREKIRTVPFTELVLNEYLSSNGAIQCQEDSTVNKGSIEA